MFGQAALAQSFLLALGDPPPGLGGGAGLSVLSADGNTLFANFGGAGLIVTNRWRLGEGYVAVPRPPQYRGSQVVATSADGSRFAGMVILEYTTPAHLVAAVWRDGVSGAPELVQWAWPSLLALSRDGSTWGGDSTPSTLYRNGTRLELFPRRGAITALSADGTSAGGYGVPPSGSGLGGAFVWSQRDGAVFFPPLAGFTSDEVMALSADGRLALGVSRLRDATGGVVASTLWTWSETGGRVLVAPPGPGLLPAASFLTGDGSIIAASYVDRASGTSIYDAHLYFTATGSWVRLEDHLQRFGVSTAGWEGFRLGGISDDGLTFAGTGYYQGVYQHFYARIPAPASAWVVPAAWWLATSRRRRVGGHPPPTRG